ncbi:glycerol-3-phosphate cytidylyltransferase [Lentibacillus halophilus]|uniref:Glycerol-3-phosphate cytidylyltransferase n=1 Tax=Lentibacillus halophilus TaxID=295065 RepID=A0ABP3J446_9BACI
MKTVITYGTFDLLHQGHINLLRRARILGDYLIVGVSTDAFNATKHKQAYNAYEKRKNMLRALPYVGDTIAETSWDQKIRDISTHHVDVFVMGDDWKGAFDGLRAFCEVVYLPRTAGISTTTMKHDHLKRK